MYHAQFGLERSLFGDGIAADAAVFRSPKHDQISAHFKLALGSPSSCLVLRGPAGVGKTTFTSAALRASSTRLALAWLNAAPTNAAELLELVLVELGVGTAGTTRVDRLQLWRQFQGEMRTTESRLFVVVERTEDFACEVLHALDSLTAADAAGNLGANLVLLGHAGIDEHLSAPVLESLRQRIRLRAELTPFTEAELQDYLRHQVACAGGHYDHVFAPGTVAALYRHSGGVARLANTLCATALELAASQQQKLLTAELVTKTAVSMLGLAEAAPAARSAAPVVERCSGNAADRRPSCTGRGAAQDGCARRACCVDAGRCTNPGRRPSRGGCANPARCAHRGRRPKPGCCRHHRGALHQPRRLRRPRLPPQSPPLRARGPRASNGSATAPARGNRFNSGTHAGSGTCAAFNPRSDSQNDLAARERTGAHRRVRVRRRRDRHHRRRHGGFPRPHGRGRAAAGAAEPARRTSGAPRAHRSSAPARRPPSLRPRPRRLLQPSRA